MKDRLSQLSIGELESMYTDMKQTVDHNYHLMKGLKKHQLYV